MDPTANNVSSQGQQPQEGDASKQDSSSEQDVAQFVHTLLTQMQERFQSMSDQILNRIDDMGTRIDDLEQNLNALMNNAGIQPGMEGSQHHSSGRAGDNSLNQSNVCDSTQGANK